MSDTERINNRIDTYSEAFDFYIERREMPPEIAADDQLGAYMRQVIDENPHLVSVDPLWAEVLKENLMEFFRRCCSISPSSNSSLLPNSR